MKSSHSLYAREAVRRRMPSSPLGAVPLSPQVSHRQAVSEFILRDTNTPSSSWSPPATVNVMKWEHANEIYRELAAELVSRSHQRQGDTPVEAFLQFSSWCAALSRYGEKIRFEDILSKELTLPVSLAEALDGELCAAKGESSLSGWLQQFNTSTEGSKHQHSLSNSSDWRNISLPSFLGMIHSLDRYDTGMDVGAPFGESLLLQPYHGVSVPQRFERSAFRELYHWLAEWHGKADLTSMITTGQGCGGYLAGLVLKTRVREVECCEDNTQALLNTEEFVDRLFTEGFVPRSGREVYVTPSKTLPEAGAGVLAEEKGEAQKVSSKIGRRKQKRKSTVGRGRSWELQNEGFSRQDGTDGFGSYKGAIFATPIPSLLILPGACSSPSSPLAEAQRDLTSRNDFLAQVASSSSSAGSNSNGEPTPPLLNPEECFLTIVDHNLFQALTLFSRLQLKVLERREQGGGRREELDALYTHEAQFLVQTVKDYHRKERNCTEVIQLLNKFDTRGDYVFQQVHSSNELVFQDSFLQHYDPIRLLLTPSDDDLTINESARPSSHNNSNRQSRQLFETYMEALVTHHSRRDHRFKREGQSTTTGGSPSPDEVLEKLSSAFKTLGSMLHTRLQVIRRVATSQAKGRGGGTGVKNSQATADSKFGKWDLLGSRTGLEGIGGRSSSQGQLEEDCNNPVFLTGGVDQRQLTNPQMHHHHGDIAPSSPSKNLEYEDTEDYQHYLPPSRQSITLDQAAASSLGGMLVADAVASGAGAGYGTDFSFLSPNLSKDKRTTAGEETEGTSSSSAEEHRVQKERLQQQQQQAQENFDMLFYGEKKKLMLQGTRQTRQLRKMALRSHSSKEEFLDRFVQKNLHADLVELKNGIDDLTRLTTNKEEIRRRTEQEPNRRKAVENAWLPRR